MSHSRIAALVVIALVLMVLPLAAEQTGEPYVGRPNYEGLRPSGRPVHGGAGTMRFGQLVGGRNFDAPLAYIHYGQIMPSSGIGEHAHPAMEEMFFIFDGEAEFTQDGNTATLPPMSFVPCKLGGSHGILNRSESDTLRWLNIGINAEGSRGGANDFGETLEDRVPGDPSKLTYGTFDKSLLKPVANMHGGKGSVMYRRVFDSDIFKTRWEYIDHVLLPPGTSIGYHQLNGTEEVYYIMSGNGRVTVNDTTFDCAPWEAYPCTLHDSHGIYNNSDEDLEFFILGIAVEKGKVDTKVLGDDLTSR